MNTLAIVLLTLTVLLILGVAVDRNKKKEMCNACQESKCTCGSCSKCKAKFQMRNPHPRDNDDSPFINDSSNLNQAYSFSTSSVNPGW